MGGRSNEQYLTEIFSLYLAKTSSLVLLYNNGETNYGLRLTVNILAYFFKSIFLKEILRELFKVKENCKTIQNSFVKTLNLRIK